MSQPADTQKKVASIACLLALWVMALWLPRLGGAQEHEGVELGLPSGTLRATCNIGAASPEQVEVYFALGPGGFACRGCGRTVAQRHGACRGSWLCGGNDSGEGISWRHARSTMAALNVQLGAATVQPRCWHGAATVLAWCSHGAGMVLASRSPARTNRYASLNT